MIDTLTLWHLVSHVHRNSHYGSLSVSFCLTHKLFSLYLCFCLFHLSISLWYVCVFVCVLSGLSDSVWELTNHKTRTQSREGSGAMRNTCPSLRALQPLPPTSAALTPADVPTHTFSLSHVLSKNRITHTHTLCAYMHQTAVNPPIYSERLLLFDWIYFHNQRSGHKVTDQYHMGWLRNDLIAWLCKWGKRNPCSFPRVKFPISV